MMFQEDIDWLFNAQPEIPNELPIMISKDRVLFPNVGNDFNVGRKITVDAILDAQANSRLMLLLLQFDPMMDLPTGNDIHHVGTIIKIGKFDRNQPLSVMAYKRAKLISVTKEAPFLKGTLQVLPGDVIEDLKKVSENMKRLKRALEKQTVMDSESIRGWENWSDEEFVNLLAICLEPQATQKFLELNTLDSRLTALLKHFS